MASQRATSAATKVTHTPKPTNRRGAHKSIAGATPLFTRADDGSMRELSEEERQVFADYGALSDDLKREWIDAAKLEGQDLDRALEALETKVRARRSAVARYAGRDFGDAQVTGAHAFCPLENEKYLLEVRNGVPAHTALTTAICILAAIGKISQQAQDEPDDSVSWMISLAANIAEGLLHSIEGPLELHEMKHRLAASSQGQEAQP